MMNGLGKNNVMSIKKPVLLFVIFICSLLFSNAVMTVSAEEIIGTPDDTPGVYIYTAGTDETAPSRCDGSPAGNQTAQIIQGAIDFEILEFVGDSPAEVLDFVTGTSEETPTFNEVDKTIEEIVTGLTAIDDFGDITNGGDDDANFDTGTGGMFYGGLREPFRVIVADGIIATGKLGGLANPTNQAEADEHLDGMEIFIFEDAEFSGFQLDLYGPFNSWTIKFEDFQVNPGSINATDDILIGIDLDSLPNWDGTYITEMRLTDDGIAQPAVDSCDGVGPADQSLEIDAIATRTNIFLLGAITGNVTEDTNDDGIGDTPLVGVTLTLFDESGNPIVDSNGNPVTTITDSQGNYIFTNLPPGDYIVVETQPEGYDNVTEFDGGNDGDHPDDGIVNSIPATIGLDEVIDTGNDFVEVIFSQTAISLAGQNTSASIHWLVLLGAFVALGMVSLRYTSFRRLSDF